MTMEAIMKLLKQFFAWLKKITTDSHPENDESHSATRYK